LKGESILIKKIILVVAILAFFAIPALAAADIIDGEQVKNGTFDSVYAPWEDVSEASGAAKFSVENGELKVHVSSLGTAYWSVRMTQGKIQLVKGQTYVVKFDARSTVPGTIGVMCEANVEPWNHEYFKLINVAITDKMATYTYEFIMKEPRDNRAQMVFTFGNCDENSPKTEHDVFLDNVSLTLKK
jgi:hypothetical protein